MVLAVAQFPLRVHLALKKLETGNAKDRDVVVHALKHWMECNDLVGIRDEKELAKLPEDERKEWQIIWANVDALLKRTQGTKP